MPLSPSQIEAARLLAQGRSQQEVGDAVGVSRRTILRWLKLEDFKNLSYASVGRAASPQPVQPQRERRQQKSSLTPEDLVEDALEAIQSILTDPEVRTCDRIKAASLVGSWAGLESTKNKMAEMEALKVLVDANWVSNEVLESLINAGAEFEERMKNALANGHQNGHENGHKKALLQIPEKGLFDDEFDDEDE